MPEIGDDDVLVRVKAAGICHSDVHSWRGTSPVGQLPLTLGQCAYCRSSSEQFCEEGLMLGKDTDGGYAGSVPAFEPSSRRSGATVTEPAVRGQSDLTALSHCR